MKGGAALSVVLRPGDALEQDAILAESAANLAEGHVALSRHTGNNTCTNKLPVLGFQEGKDGIEQARALVWSTDGIAWCANQPGST